MQLRMLVALLPLFVAAGCIPTAPPATTPAAPTPAPSAPPPPTPPPTPVVPPSQPAPSPIAPGDGRQPIVAADLKKSPYRFVGRLINAKHPTSWGTGTLIGPRHVVTAAHVVEHLVKEQNAHGAPTFVLPDGRSSEITDAELDGGWRRKIVTCDFALLALKDALGAGGAHAAWAEFDDATHLGARMHVTGYDADLWVAAGQPATPVLYDRVTTVGRFNKYTTEYIASPQVVVGGIAGAAAARKLKLTGPFLGLGALGLSYYGLKGHVFDQLGWSAEDAVQAVGASGGPLWVDDPAGPRVVGVTGHAFKRGERHGIPFGRPVGSKITPGPCADMVRNYLHVHP